MTGVEGCLRGRLARLGALVALTGALLGADVAWQAAPAAAATATIGNPAAGTVPCGSVADFVQDVGDSASYAVPAGIWQMTSWSTDAPSASPVQFQLLVFRPGPTASTYTLLGRSEMQTTSGAGRNTFALAAPIVVRGGDLLGFRPGTGNQPCGRVASTSARYHARLGGQPVPNTGETITMATSLSGAEFPISATLESLPLRYEPVSATRLVDTRTGTGAPAARLAAGQVLVVQVGGAGGVPASGAVAATLNLTSATSDAGFLTAYPCDGARPSTSSLNPKPGAAVANLVTVPVSRSGTVCIATLAPTDLLVDVLGWWGTSGRTFTPVDGARLADTRASGRLSAGQVLTVAVAGRGGVPGNATAVTVNLTSANSEPGYLTAWPCDRPRPGTSAVNPQAGTAVANLADVELAADGTLCVYTETATDVLVDVVGWWGPAGLPYNPVGATRLVDSRTTSRLRAGDVVTLQVTGRGGVPGTGAAVATVNLTSVNSEPGFLTAWPCDQARPGTSSLNPQPGAAVANLAHVRLSATGTICIFSETATDVVVDLSGWWGS